MVEKYGKKNNEANWNWRIPVFFFIGLILGWSLYQTIDADNLEEDLCGRVAILKLTEEALLTHIEIVQINYPNYETNFTKFNDWWLEECKQKYPRYFKNEIFN